MAEIKNSCKLEKSQPSSTPLPHPQHFFNGASLIATIFA